MSIKARIEKLEQQAPHPLPGEPTTRIWLPLKDGTDPRDPEYGLGRRVSADGTVLAITYTRDESGQTITRDDAGEIVAIDHPH